MALSSSLVFYFFSCHDSLVPFAFLQEWSGFPPLRNLVGASQLSVTNNWVFLLSLLVMGRQKLPVHKTQQARYLPRLSYELSRKTP